MAAAIKDPAADLHAPALCDVELAAALARFLRAGLLSPGLVTLDGQLARAVTAHSWIPVLPA